MARPLADDLAKQAADAMEKHGGNETHAARALGISRGALQNRLERAVERGMWERPTQDSAAPVEPSTTFPGRLEYEIDTGIVLVGSDCHYWPGPPSVTHRAFVHFCRELRPKMVVLNGDVVDMATVSRHPPIGWERRPTVQEEIEAAQERLHEIQQAAGRVPRIWTLGNHDARFETRLASAAPEYAKVHGIHLHDHFPGWDRGWSCWINSHVVIKHRLRGGMHATWNNTIYSGKSAVTGHLHSAQVRPFTDYNGTRYGVDTGCIADTYGPQFGYMEDSPRNWISAFGVLTFYKGKLLAPELVMKVDEKQVQFGGKVIKV